MNQLSLNPIDRDVVDPTVRRLAASNVRQFDAARARLRVAPVCHWRRDPATGALVCVWTVSPRSSRARGPASPVPLRRAS